jgi:hypothetical protein
MPSKRPVWSMGYSFYLLHSPLGCDKVSQVQTAESVSWCHISEDRKLDNDLGKSLKTHLLAFSLFDSFQNPIMNEVIYRTASYWQWPTGKIASYQKLYQTRLQIFHNTCRVFLQCQGHSCNMFTNLHSLRYSRVQLSRFGGGRLRLAVD